MIRSGHDFRKNIFMVLSVMGIFINSFLCFYNLGTQTIQDWDEARHGVSAYEMIQNNDYIVTTYGYENDYWNLKPPMSEWMIALGYKLFGYNKLGLRSYSAIAMMITILVSYIFLLFHISKESAVFSLYAYAACMQLFEVHCARHGDADSLYILFYVCAIICLLWKKQIPRFFYGACLFFAFAFLTKSYHAGLILIIIAICFFTQKYYKNFRVKNYIICMICAGMPILSWMLVRIYKDGFNFIVLMLKQDVITRSMNSIEGHYGTKWYYIDFLITNRLFPVLLILCVYAIAFCKKGMGGGNLKIYISGITIPVILFTLAKTKLNYYIFCIWPIMIILASVGFSSLIKRVFSKKIKIYPIAIIISYCILLIATNLIQIHNISAIGELSDQIEYLVSRTDEYSKKEIFKFEVTDTDEWRQSELLALEMYGDLYGKNGGYSKFLESQEAYLLVKNGMLADSSGNFEIVSKNNDYCIIKHRQNLAMVK